MKRSIKLVIAITLIVSLGAGGYFFLKGKQATKQESTVVEHVVERGSIRLSYGSDGTVKLPKINLDFDIDGRVSNVYIKEGDNIKNGQLVAKLEDSDYQTAVEKARSEYNKALLNLEAAKTQISLDKISREKSLSDLKLALNQAKKTFERNQVLGDAVATTEANTAEENYQKAQVAYQAQVRTNAINDSSSKTVALAKQSVEAASLTLKEAEKNLNSIQLLSPSAGRALKIGFEAGEFFSVPKESTGTHFLTIQNAGKVEVASQISEIDLPNVFKDQIAEITFEAFPGKIYTGVVEKVAEYSMTSSNGVVTFDATIAIADADASIKDGMTCSIEFILSERTRVLTVPNKSVTFENGQQSVQIKNTKGQLVKKVIKTGLTDGKQVEVTDGLKEGDIVVYQTQGKV